MTVLLTTAQAADYVGISNGSFRNLVCYGRGPESQGRDANKPGRPALYSKADLDQWAERRTITAALTASVWRDVPLRDLRRVASIAGVAP